MELERSKARSAESKEHGAESKEHGAESREHGAESKEHGAKGKEHGAENGGNRNGLDSRFRGNDNEVRGNDIPDLPPEFCRYRDEGCELAESCLKCPFIECIYDKPGGKQRWMKRRRAREIARLHTIEGKKVKELAEMFGVSERTVQRNLRMMTPSSQPSPSKGEGVRTGDVTNEHRI